jgi:hypothetical protein
VPLYAGQMSSAYWKCLRGMCFRKEYGFVESGFWLMREMSSLTECLWVRPRGRREEHAGIRVVRR